MTVFGDYAEHYDLLYKDKDYSSEAKYVVDLVREHDPDASSILDIGCGTGSHAVEFAKQGFRVHGIDRSAKMISRAEVLRSSLSPELQSRLTFSCSDLAELQLGEKYDFVTSLFHVMSYQITETALASAIKSAHAHCKFGGLFLFDFWYGPAVLADEPAVKVKIVEDANLKVVRIAKPDSEHSTHCVNVCYNIFVLNKESGSYHEFCETHRMRYLFLPELESGLRDSDFSILKVYEWMTRKPPSTRTWSACLIARSGLRDSV
jgi:SAM-dependent methyltransferase